MKRQEGHMEFGGVGAPSWGIWTREAVGRDGRVWFFPEGGPLGLKAVQWVVGILSLRCGRKASWPQGTMRCSCVLWLRALRECRPETDQRGALGMPAGTTKGMPRSFPWGSGGTCARA
jgi:hypothetical protein